jgi:hypothetical protein
MTTREQVRLVLKRRQYLARPWMTATEVSRAFGYDGATPHIELALKALVARGEVQRRPNEHTSRSKWQYSLHGSDNGTST